MTRFVLTLIFGSCCLGLPPIAMAQSDCDRSAQIFQGMNDARQNDQYDIALQFARQLKSIPRECHGLTDEQLDMFEAGLKVEARTPPEKRLKPCNPVQTGPYSYSC